ncbi:MAG: glycosyltransferase family 2 protein [Limnohabitans sp.]|nr:glycosyltransferase family 2 protein [Limnohabitans sp.]
MPDKTPLFTIITPTFNSSAFIERLILNVQQQDFKFFEHLILDGLSRDGTADILHKYDLLFPNLRVVIEKDNGIYDAMNKGIRLAKGQWIFFIGSDDYLYDNHVLTRIAESIINSDKPPDVVYGDVWFEKYNRVYDGMFNINKVLSQNICHQSIFYKNDLFERLGNFDLRYKNCADYQFNLLCWLNADVVHVYTPVTVSFFSSGGVSTTNTDHVFIADFPSSIVRLTIESNFTFLKKTQILSDCFRKIIIRYSISNAMKVIVKRDQHFFLRFLAFVVTIATMPYYLLKNIIKND